MLRKGKCFLKLKHKPDKRRHQDFVNRVEKWLFSLPSELIASRKPQKLCYNPAQEIFDSWIILKCVSFQPVLILCSQQIAIWKALDLCRNANGGGLLVYVRSDIPSHRLNSFKFSDGIEFIRLEINLRKNKQVLFSVYRPPNQSQDYLLENLGRPLDH